MKFLILKFFQKRKNQNKEIEKRQSENTLLNKKGMATIESVSLLSIFIVILGYQLGLFGAIHSAILHSISARTFAFETFRNRTNLTYYRENVISASGGQKQVHYKRSQIRWHGVVRTGTLSNKFEVSSRPISTLFIGSKSFQVFGKPQDHNNKIYTLDGRNRKIKVNPIWVMVGYGMCLNLDCGDEVVP